MSSPDCPCGIRREACEYHKPTAPVFGPMTEEDAESYDGRINGYFSLIGNDTGGLGRVLMYANRPPEMMVHPDGTVSCITYDI